MKTEIPCKCGQVHTCSECERKDAALDLCKTVLVLINAQKDNGFGGPVHCPICLQSFDEHEEFCKLVYALNLSKSALGGDS